MPKAPLNVSIIEPTENIQAKGWLPVTSHSMFEASTQRFHPDGLYSEAIFGQIGSTERLIRRGYLDLKTRIISPHLFRQFIGLKSIYKEVLAGKQYAIYDKEIKDLVGVSPDHIDGRTGYSFVIETYPKLKFPQTSSQKRADKIALLDKFNDRMFIERFLIIPAGLRDVKEENGRMTPEEINKIYGSLLSLTQALPDGLSEDPVFDAIRYQIQMKVQQIYEYLMNLINGKGGFAQSKYAARGVMFGTRNVITGATVSRSLSPNSPNTFRVDEVEAPLFQAMKASQPLMVNRLKQVFFDTVFSSQSTTVPLINPETYVLEYREVSGPELKKYMSSKGIGDLIDNFRDPHIQKTPFTVTVADNKKTPDYYLYMIYDNDDEIYFIRGVDEFRKWYSRETLWSTANVEPLKHLQGIDPSKVIVIASSALQIYGRNRAADDLDVLMDEDLFEQLRKNGEITERSPGVWSYKDGEIDIVTSLPGPTRERISFAEVKKTANTVEGVQVASLDWLLMFYKTLGRVKDVKKIEFLQSMIYDPAKLRPMTWVEMFYVAAYSGLKDKYCTTTRHPVLNLEGIRTDKVHVVTTMPGRIVRIKTMSYDDPGVLYPEYPRLDREVKTSMCVHPTKLMKFDGDFDGDVLGFNILMTDEATAEQAKFMELPISLVDANGSLVDPLGCGKLSTVRFTLFAWTYHSLE